MTGTDDTSEDVTVDDGSASTLVLSVVLALAADALLVVELVLVDIAVDVAWGVLEGVDEASVVLLMDVDWGGCDAAIDL